MNPFEFAALRQTRRTFLASAAQSTGCLGLLSLLGLDRLALGAPQSGAAMAGGGIAQPRHVRPRIKRLIHLYMAGGPSQLESFDYKPRLAELNGQAFPDSYTRGQPIAQLQGAALRAYGPQFTFNRHGKSQMEISSVFPYIAKLADDICVIRSMQTEQINHDPAHTFMNTGTAVSGRPSMGAWVLYGLGSESSDLPGFIVLTSGGGKDAQPIAARQWHSGFLPSRYQGVQLYAAGDPVHYVRNAPGVDEKRQRDIVDAVNRINARSDAFLDDPEIATRIAQYEMAFRMQASVPDLMDLSGEPEDVLEMYGTRGGDGSFASNCLLARRLVERGVRFIQLYHRGWDHHTDLKPNMVTRAREVDQASWALVTDLKRRGMLDDTLVVWGGEFGRTPMGQLGSGRDHHIRGFSIWLAGGGVKPGFVYGATDELGYNAVENPVHVHNLHATLLHLFGIDHNRLTYRHQGLDVRLTGVEPAHVVRDILA